MPVEKNKEYIVEIIDNGFAGEGIAKINDFTIFIPNTLKGEKVKVLIVKVLKSHAFGKIVEILEKSQDRVECDCNTYKRCGGCDLRHVKYEKTLEMKQNAVQSLVNKTLKNKINVKETLGMDNPYYYRNKAQYPVGSSTRVTRSKPARRSWRSPQISSPTRSLVNTTVYFSRSSLRRARMFRSRACSAISVRRVNRSAALPRHPRSPLRPRLLPRRSSRSARKRSLLSAAAPAAMLRRSGLLSSAQR